MIEPPSELVRRGVFEVDDSVLIAIEHRHVKQIAGPMEQTFVRDLGVRMDAIFIESRERCRRRDPVEAMTVIQETKFHFNQRKRAGDSSNRIAVRQKDKSRSSTQERDRCACSSVALLLLSLGRPYNYFLRDSSGITWIVS